MLRSGLRRYTTRITFLPRRRLHSESQNIQNVDKLLNAVRQCNDAFILSRCIEKDAVQVIDPPAANREHAIVPLGPKAISIDACQGGPASRFLV